MIAARTLDGAYGPANRTGPRPRPRANVPNRGPMMANVPARRDRAELASRPAHRIASRRRIP